MNIYLESIDLTEIRNAAAAGLADGVSFSMSAASDADDADTRERLEEIAREFAVPICVPVGAVSSSDIYSEAKELARISDHIIVQIPLVEDSLVPMAKLAAEGVIVCASFVYSAAQAIIAAKAGAATISVSLDELERYGQPGSRTLAEIKNALEAGEEECDVMTSIVGEVAAGELERLSRQIYESGRRIAAERGIIIADTKFEFGSLSEAGRETGQRVILVDEVLTPDSSRFWPADGYEPGHGGWGENGTGRYSRRIVRIRRSFGSKRCKEAANSEIGRAHV